MSRILIYLHGLGSSGQSTKSEALVEALAPFGVTVICPDLPIEPDEVSKIVKGIVLEHCTTNLEQVVFCGTSLGGFYSSYFGEIFDAPYVIANPVTSPATAFNKYLTDPPISWVTKLPIQITKKTISDLSTFERCIKHPTMSLATVFLAKDDDVVPYQPAAIRFSRANLIITEDGGHRYELHWTRVINEIKKLYQISPGEINVGSTPT